MLHAERRICTVDAAGVRSQQGAVILHVLFDYETLPFITSQNPYYEVVRATRSPGQRRHCRRQRRGRDLRLGPAADLHLGALGLADHRRAVRPALRLARAVLGGGRRRRREAPGLFLERPRADLRHRLSGPHPVRSLRAPGGADDVRRRGVRGRADRHRAVHARRPRAPARRPRAAARDPRQLLPQAVPRVRARGHHPGADPGARDPHLLREPAAGRCRGRGGAHRGRRPAGHRGSRHGPAPQHRDRRHAQRRLDGLDQPGHRSGRQRLPRGEARRHVRARAVRVRCPADAHARRRLSRDRAGAAAELRPRGCDRRRSTTCSPPRRCAPPGRMCS